MADDGEARFQTFTARGGKTYTLDVTLARVIDAHRELKYNALDDQTWLADLDDPEKVVGLLALFSGISEDDAVSFAASLGAEEFSAAHESLRTALAHFTQSRQGAANRRLVLDQVAAIEAGAAKEIERRALKALREMDGSSSGS